MWRRSCCTLAPLRLIQSTSLDTVYDRVSSQDTIFARRFPSGYFQYFAWPGLSQVDAAEAVLSLPLEKRSVHCVFGRPGVPCHIALDIDAPLHRSAADDDSAAQRAEAQRIANEACAALNRHIEREGETLARRCVLFSPTPGKVSVHIHAELRGAVFSDAAALASWLAPLRDRIPAMDFSIYRQNGSLRMFGSAKADGTCPLELLRQSAPTGDAQAPRPFHPSWNVGTESMTPTELAVMSLVIADADGAARDRKILLGRRAPSTLTRDLRNTLPHFNLADAFTMLANGLASLPQAHAEEYGLWFKAGFWCKLVSSDPDVAVANPDKNCSVTALNAWITFSQRSLKYREGVCAKVWISISLDKPDPAGSLPRFLAYCRRSIGQQGTKWEPPRNILAVGAVPAARGEPQKGASLHVPVAPFRSLPPTEATQQNNCVASVTTGHGCLQLCKGGAAANVPPNNTAPAEMADEPHHVVAPLFGDVESAEQRPVVAPAAASPRRGISSLPDTTLLLLPHALGSPFAASAATAAVLPLHSLEAAASASAKLRDSRATVACGLSALAVDEPFSSF